MVQADPSCRGRKTAGNRIPAVFPLCLILAAMLPTAGCGSGPEMAPVSGHITVAGRPVNRGTVFFVPDAKKGAIGKAASGNSGPDGTYSLRTGLDMKGALVGNYRVAVTGRGMDDPETMPPNRQIPSRYGNPDQSGLTAEVKSEPNTLDFDLTP